MEVRPRAQSRRAERADPNPGNAGCPTDLQSLLSPDPLEAEPRDRRGALIANGARSCWRPTRHRLLVFVHPFVAVILICLNSVAPQACSSANAADVLSNGVENELSCALGWQDVVARSALAHEIGKTAYVKTLCRRTGAAAAEQPR
jgi:hypothetical protein